MKEKSRIGLPKGWEWKKISDCCNKISLNNIKIKQKDYLSNGKYPVIDQGQNIIGGYFNNPNFIVPDNPPFIIFGDHTKIKKYINFNFIAGADGVKVLKAKDFILPKLFYYFLHCIKFEDRGYARHYQLLEKEFIPIPPLNVQKIIVEKIDELFSDLDYGIENLKKVKEQLKVYRQAVLSSAFSGKLTEDWRNLEENKALYDVSEDKYIEEKKQELIRHLTFKYNSNNIEIGYRVLKDFILEAICKNVNDELVSKVMSDFPFDNHDSNKDSFLKAFLFWQTKSDEYLMLSGFSSFVLSQQRKAWIKYADDGMKGREFQNPYAGYTQTAGFQDWIQIEKLKKEGIDYFKKTYIFEPARKEYEKELELQNNEPVNLPKGWRISYLGNLAKKTTNKVLPSDNSDLKFIGMDCIEPHTLRPSFLYDFKDFRSSGNYFEKGEILYGRMRPYLNKVYKAEFNGACSGEFIILKCDTKINADLLKYILHSNEFVNFANQKTSGDRPRISYSEISEFSIKLPNINEQHKIVEEIETRLSVCDKIEETIESSLIQSESLRQSILKKAFEGKLV